MNNQLGKIELDRCDFEYGDFSANTHFDEVSTASEATRVFENKILSLMHPYGKDIDVVCTNSGTATLFLALKSHGIGKGDYVIVPDITYVASANAILMTGAMPIIMSINKSTWCLDLDSPDVLNDILMIRKYKAGRIAVMPVNLYGMVPTYKEKVYSKLEDAGIPIIFDSAESFGVQLYDNHLHCYSFNGNKILTTGGGGCVIGFRSYIDKIRNMIRPRSYDGVGYNYGMPGLNAAFGINQIKRMDGKLADKKYIYKMYYNGLHNIPLIEIPWTYIQSNWYFPIKLTTKEWAVKLATAFNLASPPIPTRGIFPPLSTYSHLACAYKYQNDFGVKLWRQGLCLPVAPSLTLEQQEYIIKTIREVLC